jgi:hypothetical protein
MKHLLSPVELSARFALRSRFSLDCLASGAL